MADLGQTAAIDTTIAALQQGITTIPVEQAIAVIESWQQQLQGLAIADDLGELKQALQKQKSADAIANLLLDLGEDTAEELAIETSEDVTAKIRQLASLLTQAGNALKR
ncbi:MAG: hypothetical protein JO235_27835 [Chroococcidiopsidaceae cyanobacterium CP_BM_RX_35]|nr:hypothetical protein [Chroococcidiopsidaceae cyanobacterium CP_BM_RX_35]